MTVKLWDMQTGGIVKTFFGHINKVRSVSISAGCTRIASGSNDKTIRLWDIQTGECCHTIQQRQVVYQVMFSPKDPQHLTSISCGKVWQWDGSGCQIRPPFGGSHVTFSSDGSQFVSCLGKTITVHNSSSGTTITHFQVADDSQRCCFSPDNKIVAVAVGRTTYCWDITTSKPQLVETFIGHTQMITSLVFSSFTALVSASQDKSVRFWQTRAQSTDPPITSPKPMSLPSALIESVTLQSKEGIAITSDSEGIIKTWDTSTGICKTSFQTPAKDSYRRDTQLVNGKVVFVWCTNRKMHVWDTEKGELLQEVKVPSYNIQDLRISGDGSRFFGLYVSSIWAWSLQTGEVMGRMEIGHCRSSGSLIVDGSKVWACWPGSNPKGWDFGIDSAPMELPNISTPPSPSRLWDPEQARIKHPSSGEAVFQLSGRFLKPVYVQCDDAYLVSGYQSGEILIFDLTNVK